MRATKVSLRRLRDEYEVKEEVIGEGAYGKVYMATRGQQAFAVKVMHPQGEGGRYKLVTSNASLREIKLLRELSHPNIVRLRDQFLNLDDMTLALVYDYGECQCGSWPCHIALSHKSRPDTCVVHGVCWHDSQN
mgnify:CR=1 FL=1